MKDKKGCYIIAEVGPNHNGNLEVALKYVEALAAIGVDAVKFQMGNPLNSYSLDAFKANYQEGRDKTKSPIEMSKRYQLAFEDHIKLYERCKEVGVDYSCSAFEMDSLNFLWDNIPMPFFKIPSGEIFTLDMVDFMAQKDLPIILSTGMSTFEEIEKGIALFEARGPKDITILHCVSSYPASPEDINLNVMLELRKRFGRNVGYSDHMLGNEASIAAVALGATVVEKHVTFDKNDEGPDHQASASIEEFADLVKAIRKVETLMGTNEKIFTEKEIGIKKVARKSIVAKTDLPVGHIITQEDLCYKRPGFGYLPTEQDQIIGKKVSTAIEGNRVIRPEHLA
jgi:N,N'-diacetyllegionaminate synthase